ncbi:MAG: Zn-ribbon domain-containing OB-fold protein [Rhodospirillales bacterium]
MGAETVAEAMPLLAAEGVEIDGAGAPWLVGSVCADCGAKVFPPVHVCPECMSEKINPLRLSRHGTLYSWSVVHVAPKGWKVPYIAGYVDLPEGVRVFTHVVGADPKALTMDMTVSLTTATLGTGEDGRPMASYAFTPAA